MKGIIACVTFDIESAGGIGNGDAIMPCSGSDGGLARMRVTNDQAVVAGSQLDIEFLKREILDSAFDFATTDHGVTTESKPCQAVSSQNTRIIRRTVTVEDIQDINLIHFINCEVRIEWRIVVIIADERLEGLPRFLIS